MPPGESPIAVVVVVVVVVIIIIIIIIIINGRDFVDEILLYIVSFLTFRVDKCEW
jgi:hypothetical protein